MTSLAFLQGNICYIVPALAWGRPLLSNQEVVLGWVEHIKDLVSQDGVH